MKKFWKWAVILMTATMAAGLATSCEKKDNPEPEKEPEEEPVTIRKTWLVFDEEYGYYAGHDFGAINGKYCSINCLIPNQEMADAFNKLYHGVEVSVNDIVYVVPEDMGADISMEITETDATSGTVRLTESRWLEYKNLTKDSVTLIAYEDDASIVYEVRTPAGWGLTVNNYVDLTPAIQ